MSVRRRFPRQTSMAAHHLEWLGLVDVSGPFLSSSSLLRVFPQGLEEVSPELKARLRLAHEEWLDEASKEAPDPAVHGAWVRYVFRELLGFEARDVLEGQALPAWSQVEVPQHHERLAPTFALRGGDGRVRLFVTLEGPAQDLDKPTYDRPYRASPATRMMTLLLGAQGFGGPRLGLVTNGRAWQLVHARPGEPTSYVQWSSELFFDEPLTLRAFVSLLGLKRFFNVPDGDTLEALLAESAKDQQEVTDQLGEQVRRAVEVLIQTIDRLDRGRRGALLRGLAPTVLYEAAITVMMRLVFLLAAEERGLLLKGNALYDQSYAVGTLRDQLQELADRLGEEVLERRHDAWSRLCATFRAIFAGIDHEDLRLPAYGGSLFDPDRFPFLEGRVPGTSYKDEAQVVAQPLAIDNRTVLHLLRAIQELELAGPAGGRAERRRLSFRSLDVEQIGHVYEGLLDHTVRRAEGPTLSLLGKHEPEISIAELERRKQEDPAALIEWLSERTGRSKSAVATSLEYVPQRDDQRRLLQACENRSALYQQAEPWAGLIRRDTHDLPVVLDAGAVYVTAGDERRATGTHYTPRTLTEPVVEHTLAPLVYDGPAEGKPPAEWRLKSPREILALRVCDLAMGSGAFLVEACRYLAARVVEAWEAAEASEGHELRVAPDGELSVGALGETLIPPLRPAPGRSGLLPGMLVAEGPLFADPPPKPADAAQEEEPPKSVRGRPSRPPTALQARQDERLAMARRYVADRCLFGVDKNPWAVEMAKLSLWLVTLQKNRPFTFLDHALVAGDSLLGIISKEQLLAFHLEPARGRQLHELFAPKKHVEGELRRAAEAREKIERLATATIVEAHHKAYLEREAREATADLKLLADLVVGAALASSGRDNVFERTLRDLAEEALRLLPGDDEAALPGAERVRRAEARDALRPKLRERAQALLQQGRGPAHSERTPLHWPLVFPEVAARGGFDAFVGNPPFQGGQRLTGALGTDYRDYLVQHLAEGRRGSADLCAYFYLRAANLLRTDGTFGLIATNTIAQGDTREVGLDALLASGCTLTRAVPSMKWPGEANLEVATIWLRKGAWGGAVYLEDKPVQALTSQLSPPGRATGKPYRLKANEGKSFIGSYVLGLGFTMSPEDAAELIRKNPKNKDVLFPYLNGQDLNTHPEQRAPRWVINFFDWPLNRENLPTGHEGPVAADYPECLDRVRRLVKPERDKNNRAVYRTRWWHYAEKRPKLYAALKGHDRVLARALSGKFNAFVFVSTRVVIDQTAPAFVFDEDSAFALLVSSIHATWSLMHGATLKGDPRYTPSDCFETFPFPLDLTSLESIGERYHSHRAALMKANQQGLTATYNRFHDPDDHDPGIQRLRELHVELDLAVRDAYGWSDLELGHGFHETRQGLRFTVSELARVELLDRLLELNHQRYAEEVAAGLHPDAGGAPRSAKGAGKPKGKARPKQAARPAARASSLPASARPAPEKPRGNERPQLGLTFDPPAQPAPAPPAQSDGAARLGPAARKLWRALRGAKEPLGKSALLEKSGIAEDEWRDALEELRAAGVVEQHGERRGAKYRFVE